MQETWLRTDEREDILASLRMVNNACDEVVNDLNAWKWIVIGCHSALQGAMILHLAFGNDLLVASEDDAAAWLDAYENGTPSPSMTMDNFLSLYKKIKQHEILGYRFEPDGAQGGEIRRLNRFRNKFVHFMPRGWSIELSGMPKICNSCLDVVAQLEKNSLYIRWENKQQRQSFANVLGECQSKLSAVNSEYSR